MIWNYFKITWRSLKKKRLYTLINIIGLFTGISFALLIAVFVWQEFQGNKNLKNAESQYILTSQWKDSNMGVDFATLGPIAQELKIQYPHLVADYYRWDGITSIISKGSKIFREGIQLGDESFIDMYGFNLLHGDTNSVFEKPFSVVIKPEKAIKFFGKTDVIGETLTIQNFNGEHREFTITGVLESIPENSVSLVINNKSNGIFIAKNSATYFNRANFQDWQLPIFACYIELQNGINGSQLELPIKRIIDSHTSEAIQDNLKVLPVKLTDYHLNRNNARLKQMLYTLSFVGLFIILMALINFINIAIGHSGNRLREIGVRKVMGGKRKQLIFQFLSESILLVAISTVLACLTYPFLSDWFEALIGKQIIDIFELPLYFLCVPILFIWVVGVLAGFYPAFVLSSFNPTDALREKLIIGKKSAFLRKALLGFQYVLALVVLITAILVTQQLDSFFGKGLGYDKDYLVTTSVPRDWSAEGVQNMLTVRNEFLSLSSVASASLSYEIPNGNNGFQIAIYKAGENPEQSFATQGLVSDEAYLNTYQIPLLAGTFLEPNENNPNEVVINEEALQTYGFETAEAAIGHSLKVVGESEPLTIKGVIANFHFESMQQPIKPQIFFSVSTMLNYRYMSFRLRPGNISQSLTEIEQKWKLLMPTAPFEYKFMDDNLGDLYRSELQLKKSTYTASLLSLIIALLGIFGMVSLNINRRLKEVGIRKVLGASVQSISILFIKEFLVVLVLSMLIACPLAYFLVDDWLANYAYRIAIGLNPFLIGILLIGVLTTLLIMFQTLKAAIANPVNSLRSE